MCVCVGAAFMCVALHMPFNLGACIVHMEIQSDACIAQDFKHYIHELHVP